MRSGGSAASASATGAACLRRPALDAVGEQVAPGGGQRERRDRGDQRVGVGRRRSTRRRRERLERPGAALGLGARAQPRERRVDLRLVGARDQVGGLDLGLSRGPAKVGRVYSPPRPLPGGARGLDAADQDAERAEHDRGAGELSAAGGRGGR